MAAYFEELLGLLIYCAVLACCGLLLVLGGVESVVGQTEMMVL